MHHSDRVARHATFWVGASAVIGLLFAAMACAGPRAPTPAGQPTAGSASSSADAAAAWERVVAAAKAEGEIVLVGPPGTAIRDVLAGEFQQRYPEIRVDYSSMSGSQVPAKLLPERQAGMFRTDLVFGGTSTHIADLMPAGALDPIRPFLVGPEVQDESKWLGGRFDFSDDAAEYNLVYVSGVKVPIAYHPQMIAPSEIKSYRSLLDPKWRAKVATLDPRGAGAGLATATFFYSTPSLGPTFLRQLLGSGIVLSKDDRQILNWVTRGQYPIVLAPSEAGGTELKSKGLPLEFLDADALEESSYLTSGFGSTSVLNRAPHPNAVKVYLNWLLSREGQALWTVAHGYPSRRLDAPTDHLRPGVVPKPGVQYQENYKEPYVHMKDEVAQLLRTEIRD
jgi:iron(III) transport system substrate-binding protein